MVKIRFKFGSKEKNRIRYKKDNNTNDGDDLISTELRRRKKDKDNKLEELRKRAEEMKIRRKKAEEKLKLKNEIREAKIAEHKAKYAGWYRAGTSAKKGLRRTSKAAAKAGVGFAKRADKATRSNEMATLFGMPGGKRAGSDILGWGTQPKRKTKRKRKIKRRPKRVEYY